MVVPVTFQQLSNPGLGAGVAANSSVLDYLSGILKNRNNTNNTILSQLGLGIREKLQGNRTLDLEEARIARDRLEAQQTADLLGIKLPEGSVVSPTSIRAAALATNPNALLNQANKAGSILTTASNLGSPITPEATAMYDTLVNRANQSVHKGGGGQQGGAMQGQPTQTTAQPMPTANADGSYSLNAVQEGDRPKNLIERQAEAKTAMKELDLRKSEQGSLPSGYANFEAIKQGRAVDIGDQPFNFSPNETGPVIRIQKGFAMNPPGEIAKASQRIANSANDLQKLTKLSNEFMALRSKNKGMLAKARINLILEGKLSAFDNPTPVEQAAMRLFAAQRASGMSIASELNGGRNVSDMDVDIINKAMGDPGMAYPVFKKTMADNLANQYLIALSNSAALNADTYNQLKGDLESLTGETFNLNDMDNVNKWSSLIGAKLGQGDEIQAGGKVYIPSARTAQPATKTQTVKQNPRAVSGNVMNIVDRWNSGGN